MRVLALDTTTRSGSVALINDQRIESERGGDATRTHAERLPQEILSLLADHQLSTPDIDLFAVASGPGSFTGLRVGIATVQALALVHGRRVVGVSALEALAHVAGKELAQGSLVGAWMDAGRAEVFSALYRLSAASSFSSQRLVEVEAAAVGGPGGVLERWADLLLGGAPVVLAGPGAVMYGELIRAHRLNARVEDVGQLAGAIGLIADGRAAAGETVDPAGVRPLYVRRPDAELDRERKRAVTRW
jgi:tRNA threonylcarbamoyladenosine biosynthesis protein TsaB